VATETAWLDGNNLEKEKIKEEEEEEEEEEK